MAATFLTGRGGRLAYPPYDGLDAITALLLWKVAFLRDIFTEVSFARVAALPLYGNSWNTIELCYWEY